MGILDSIIDFNQSKRIEKLKGKYDYVEKNSESIYKHEVLLIGLENQIEQMALLFRTLYDLGVSKGLFTKEEFKTMFDKIDLEDGIKDRKLTRKNN
jgi:hypothetical protein